MLWDILRGVALISFAGAALLLLVPEGMGRRVLSLGLGAAVAVCVISPLQGLRGEDIARRLRTAAESFASGATEEENKVQKEILCDQIVAYIEMRAEELGISCTAEAELKEETGGFGVSRVVLRTDAAETDALVSVIAAELGMGEEQIQCLKK